MVMLDKKNGKAETLLCNKLCAGWVGGAWKEVHLHMALLCPLNRNSSSAFFVCFDPFLCVCVCV